MSDTDSMTLALDGKQHSLSLDVKTVGEFGGYSGDHYHEEWQDRCHFTGSGKIRVTGMPDVAFSFESSMGGVNSCDTLTRSIFRSSSVPWLFKSGWDRSLTKDEKVQLIDHRIEFLLQVVVAGENLDFSSSAATRNIDDFFDILKRPRQV